MTMTSGLMGSPLPLGSSYGIDPKHTSRAGILAWVSVCAGARWVTQACWIEHAAWAQQNAETDTPPAASTETVFSLAMKGGPLMYPIFICSVIIVTLAIERAISLRRRRIGTEDLLVRVIEAAPTRQQALRDSDGPAMLNEAKEICSTDESLVGNLLESGLQRLHLDEERARDSMVETAGRESHLLQRKLRPFAIVGNLAPLLGLLGTVFGMILCFEQVSVSAATERSEKLSDGIYRALVTTAAGMTVAIPAMVLNFLYQGKVDRIIDVLERVSSLFLEHYYSDPSDADGRTEEDDSQRVGETARVERSKTKRRPTAAPAGTGTDPAVGG